MAMEIKEKIYQVGDIFTVDAEYSARAKWCNENQKMIVEIEKNANGERQFQIQEIPAPTEEDLKAERIWEIKQRLNELDEDIVQDMAGEVVPEIDLRKAEFIELHNELRTLLGKEPRAVKGEQNALQ